MISSGLVVQKRARFEEGHPSDHNGLNRYVHEERPYVQTKIYSQLPPSEYADPELKPRYTTLSETKYEHLFEHQLTPDERLYLFEQATQNGGQIGRTYGDMPTYNVNTPMVLPHETNVEDGRMDGTAPTPYTPKLYPEVPSHEYEPVVYPEVPEYEPVVMDDLVTELNAETFIERIQNGAISAIGDGASGIVRGVGMGIGQMIWNQVNVRQLFSYVVPADLYKLLMLQTGTELSIRALLPPYYAEKVINFGRTYVDTQRKLISYQRRVHERVTDFAITGQRGITDTFSESDFAERFKNVFSNAEIAALEMINYQPDSTDSLIRSVGENMVGIFPQAVYTGVLTVAKLCTYILSAPGRRHMDNPRMLNNIASQLNGIYWQNPTGSRRLT